VGWASLPALNLSRKQIENMLSLSALKHTKFYQEAFKEGEELTEQKTKLAMVPK
jgi:predicted transposase YdaD